MMIYQFLAIVPYLHQKFPSQHPRVRSDAVTLLTVVQWWQMGYHVEAKDIPDANAMPDLAQQQVNMPNLLHFVSTF